MKDKILPLVLILGMTVIGTVIAVRHEINTTVVKRMVSQQEEILALLKQGAGKGEPSASPQQFELLNNKIDALAKIAMGAGKQPSRPGPKPEDYNTAYTIPMENAVVKGKKDAPVMITGFLDLQCPFSKRFQPVIEEVLKAYPDKVSYVVKHFPLGFHKQAAPAAKAVLAAGEQGKYYEMLDVILQNNRSLSEEKFKEFAKDIGLNVKKFEQDLDKNNDKWEALIKKDMMLGSKVDVRGTPTFYVNGKKTRSRSLNAFKQEIDKLLAEKK